MVAGREIVNERSAFEDFAGSFVTERHGYGPGTISIDHGKVGMAEARRPYPNEHFAGPR